MSWQGDQEQPPSTGRGRRRRDDGAAEDQYASAQEAGYGEQQQRQAAPYGESAGQDTDYAPYQGYGYGQSQAGYAQPGYGDTGYGSAGYGDTGQNTSAYGDASYGDTSYGDTSYGDTAYGSASYGDTGYGRGQGYGDTGHGTTGGYAGTGYADTGYADPGYSDAGYSGTGYADAGYSEAGYADPAYGYAQPQAPNLNSSGFYQLAEPAAPPADPFTPAAPAAPQESPYQQPSVPQQPAYTPQTPQQPQYWQQQVPVQTPQQAPEPPAAPAAPAPAPPAPAPVRPQRPESRVIESHVISSHVIDSRVVEAQAAEPRNVVERQAETSVDDEPAVRTASKATTAAAAASSASTASTASEKPAVRGIDEDIRGFLSFVESRADSRLERAKRARFRLIVLGVLVALVGGGTGVWALLSGGSSGPKSTQTTVLLQIRDSSENAIGSVVLVADKNAVAGKPTPTGAGAAMLIPAELSVQNAALESQPFGGAMPQTPPAGKDALADLLGVDVDGVWTVDELTFAAFLSNLGGVYVDVDVPVTSPTGQVLIPAGKHQQLDGTKAVAYAAYRLKDEPPAAGLARFGQVVNGMLARIPTDPKLTDTLLNSLAAVPDPALPNDRLAAILSALGAEQQSSHYQLQTLPVRQDGSGLLDLDAASKVVAQVLPGAVHSRDNGGLTRVAVTDATGRLDIVSSSSMAGSKLLNGGYTPLMLGPVQSTPTSYVEVPNSGAEDLGRQIAETLGLADSAVKVTPFDTTLVDAHVVLGQDWTSIGQVPADVTQSQLDSLLPSDGPSDSAAPPDGGASFSAPSSSNSGSKPGTKETTPQGKKSSAKP